MKRTLVRMATIAVLACGAAALAQQPPRGPAGPDPIGEQVFPPELILQHQRAISLTDAQRTTLVAEIKRVQGSAIDKQVDLQRGVERLIDALKPDRVDEALALAQLDTVLAAEREVKRQHIALAARLKNLLTPEQQQQLRQLRGAPPRP
jgi:Spy/CpxP family protein refolding chaperone